MPIFALLPQVKVNYAGQEVPQSPIRVPVQPHVDVSKVKVDGLEPSEWLSLFSLLLERIYRTIYCHLRCHF